MPFPPDVMAAVAAELSRIAHSLDGSAWDVPRTVEASSRAGGRLEPRYRPRRDGVPIVILVDREEGDHPFLHVYDALLDHWRRDGLSFERWDFTGWLDRLVAPDTRQIALDDLARQRADAVVMVLTRVRRALREGDKTTWVTQLDRWPQRAVLLDPDPRPPRMRLNDRAVPDEGPPHLPLTETGLFAAARGIAHRLPVGAEGGQRLGIRAGREPTELAARRDESPRLGPVERHQLVELGRPTRQAKIEHLPAHHPARAGRPREGADLLDDGGRRERSLGEQLEGHGEQRVAHEDRGGLVELDVHGRTTAALVVVVHRGQVVVHERVGVHQLDRRRCGQGEGPIGIGARDRLESGDHPGRTHALAPAEHGVGEGAVEPGGHHAPQAGSEVRLELGHSRHEPRGEVHGHPGENSREYRTTAVFCSPIGG